MKKIVCLLLTVLLALGCAPAMADRNAADETARAAADLLEDGQKQVNVFTWTYYIPDEVVEAFMDATGIAVNYSPFLDNEDVSTKLAASPGQYDIVVCSDYMIADMAKSGLLDPVDAAALPNYANIDAKYQGQYFDPDNLYTIPYTFTVPLIVYDPDRVDFEVKGYADLWRDEFAGSLALIAEWRGVIGMAQKKLGYGFNETDPEKMANVQAELMSLKKNICVMNDDTPHNALISGDAIAGYMYGSQIVAARQIMPQLKVVYPEEGLGFGIDCIVTAKDMPHKDAAYIFMNYLLDGEVSAWASDLIDYGNCNTAAVEFMTDEFRADDTVNAPEEALAAAEMMRPLDEETTKLYDAVWTAFKQS